jgi:hypothetical protein
VAGDENMNQIGHEALLLVPVVVAWLIVLLFLPE